MTQPDDTDRKAAEEFISGPYRRRTPGKEPGTFAGLLAQFHADARAAGAAEMRERYVAKIERMDMSLFIPFDNSKPTSWDEPLRSQIAAAIRALK